MVPGRDETQCRQRWNHTLKPGKKNGKWSPKEDAQLIALVGKYGTEWQPISDEIPGRTTKQCSNRWISHLDPSIKKGPFEPEEDMLLLTTIQKIGARPSQIAEQMPGRTAEMVKNRIKVLSRKAKRDQKDAARNGGRASSGMIYAIALGAIHTRAHTPHPPTHTIHSLRSDRSGSSGCCRRQSLPRCHTIQSPCRTNPTSETRACVQ